VVSLPPRLWADLFYDGAWNDVSRDVRAVHTTSVTRGLSSESAQEAEPVSGEITLNNRGRRYAPRDPSSVVHGRGRNTPIRYGYRVGSPWAEMTGTAGNKLTTPDSADLAVTDVDLRLDLALEDWSQQKITGRYETTGDNRSWGLLMAGTGQVSFLWSADGTLAGRISEFSTVPLQAYNGQRLALRITLDVDNGAGGYELRFYAGRTVDDEEGEWNLLGDPVVGASTTAVFDGTAGIELGDIADLVDPSVNGKIYAFKLLDGIGGSVAASMTTADAAVGVRSFTSGGVVWTVEGAATLTNKHTRMSGEVPEWPAARDQSGNESRITVTPAGVSRRMDAGNKPQDSALLRFIKAAGPIECWPLTDGENTVNAKSLVGGRDMIQRTLDTDTAPGFAGGRLADWIEPVVKVAPDTTGALTGKVPNSSAAAAKWSVDLFMRGGGNESAGGLVIYDRGAGTDADNQFSVFMVFNGNLDSLATIYTLQGDTASSQTLLTSGTGAAIYDEGLHHIRLTMDPGATDTGWEMYTDGTLLDSGTLSGIVVKAVSTIDLRFGFLTLTDETMTERGFGYVTYWDGDGPTAAEMWEAANGFQGERAGARIERLAAEAGYTATVAGEEIYQRPMGIQGRKKLLELLNEANKTNFGYLVEARDRNELIHRSHSTLWNQHPALVIDFRGGLVSGYKWRDDDRLTENDVSVKREYGGVPSRQVLEEGELSVQDYPDGVGRYDKEYTYSLYEDADAAQTAFLRLHLGTYNGVRVTKLTLDLANPRVHQMIDDILRTDCGDLIRLTLPPDELGPDDIDILVNGYTEEADDTQWKITFVGVPGDPWRALTVGVDGFDRIDTAGCELAEDLDETETGVDVLTTALYRWVDSATYPDDFPFVVATGGEWMRVTACTGTTLSQTFTVVRGINGVRETHPSGQPISLARPVYIPL
jgi:hypothetical protein